MSEPFIAEIKIFAGNFAPRGWAFCNGQLLPIAQNTALFSLIGTTYGGDGRTSTALPNLQGSAAMHPGRGPGLSQRRLGERGGSATEVISIAQMPSHSHTLMGSSQPANSGDPVDGQLADTAPNKNYGLLRDTETLSDETVTNTGDSNPHNNLQPFLGLHFVIALIGLYPSRS